MAEVAKALGDPVRLQLVDVLRKHAGKVCQCELLPLFDMSQPAAWPSTSRCWSEAGVPGHRAPGGLWAYYYLLPDRTGGTVRMAELDQRPAGIPAEK